jgi:hypothetical protein
MEQLEPNQYYEVVDTKTLDTFKGIYRKLKKGYRFIKCNNDLDIMLPYSIYIFEDKSGKQHYINTNYLFIRTYDN